MQVHTQTVRGEVYNDHDRPPRRFAPGRMCAEADCDTHLSIYNESDYCSRHHLGVKPRIGGKQVK